MTPIDPAILAKFSALPQFGPEPPKLADYGNWAAWKEQCELFAIGYQLCAAEKQAEIDELKQALDIEQGCVSGLTAMVDELKARIATLERENTQLLAEADALESKLHDLEQQRQQDREEIERLRAALGDIINPIAAMQRDLPEGHRLDGVMAINITKDPEHYMRIARNALKEPNHD